MFIPAPIEKDFVPYTKRPMLKRNAGMFVNNRSHRGGSAQRVIPQNSECAGVRNGAKCGSFPGLYCCEGECVSGGC